MVAHDTGRLRLYEGQGVSAEVNSAAEMLVPMPFTARGFATL